jgi:excisionase family DNA binding protein
MVGRARARRCPVTNQRLLTLLEVADMLRLSPHTIRAMVRKGRLQPVRISRWLLFSPDEVSRLLAASK